MKGSAAIATILKMEGVEFITCYPTNPLIEACASVGIRPILARNERVAVNIADGFSRATFGRRIGVTCMQYGPGVENAFPGVAQAYTDNVPLLMLPGAYERARQGVPPNFISSRSYHFVSKWAENVNSADRIPQMLRRAFTLLRSGRPGPVVLEVPADVANEEVREEAFHYAPVKGWRPAADPQDVQQAVQAILSAKAPVIMAGQGVLYAEAWDELRDLAERLEIPVFTTLNGKSAFPEDHPLALGCGGRSVPLPVAHFLRKADLVIGIGTSFTRSAYIVPIPPGKTLLQITISEDDINKDYPIDLAVIGDVKVALRQMLQEVQRLLSGGRRGDGKVKAEVATVKQEYLRAWLPRLTSDDLPISPFRVIWDLMHTLDRRRAIVTHDAGYPRDQMTAFYEALIPRGYIGWGKSTQLGTGLGLAMGAKLAHPDKVVVNLMGDAAFGMVGMDVETAVRERIPILTIVMDNQGMSGYERYLPTALSRYQTTNLSGDYAKVAEGLGAWAERVERPQDIVPALRRAIAVTEGGRPAFLHILTRKEPIFPQGEARAS
ncbi:Glyoxylate carboligase [bacterium HR23]|nr:Glyoxylate carboligase [bacterium HR23]